ncbi:MAG: hypothetical protein K5765_04830 [Clostridia bacterium]|nr:hypothetical protein [Clostridia bacterium]
MKIYAQLFDCINKLGKSNFISGPITITELLKETSVTPDLLDYISTNISNINFYDELNYFLNPKNDFPSKPEVAIPFIYSLLFIFDENYDALNELNLGYNINQITLEKILGAKYQGVEIKAAYKQFILNLSNTLYSMLFDLTEKEEYSVSNQYKVSGNPRIGAIQFFIRDNLDGEAADKTLMIVDNINNAMKSKDKESAKKNIMLLIKVFDAYGLKKDVIDNLINN